jgi:hypothetical protein
MLSPILNKLKWSATKNLPDLKTLVGRGYPDFIYDSRSRPIQGEVPVFVFHGVDPETFEEQMDFLHRNGYQTLTCAELREMMTGGKPPQENSVILTFDDGSISLWSVAFPVLEKYGYHAIAFIVPGCIHNGDAVRPTLKDVWRGKLPPSEISLEHGSTDPLCTWKEIRAMHRSGTVEFQSHTLYHHLVMTGPRLIDFYHPKYDRHYFGNIQVPLFRQDDHDLFERQPPFGTPIYRSMPRMGSRKRFFDNETIRNECVQYVADRGGNRFFRGKRWRGDLYRFFKKVRKRVGNGNERYEKGDEQRESIFIDLRESRSMIEKYLPGSEVVHLCYPWYTGSDLSVSLSKEAGYRTNFWGIMPVGRCSRPGDDPYKISRIEDRYIFRLPGVGRKRLRQILMEKVGENAGPFVKRLIPPHGR